MTAREQKTEGTPITRECPLGHEKPSRAFCPATPTAIPRRRDLTPRRQPSRERERERERRVSDADASYNGPARSTRTPKHVHSQRNHAKNPLSKRPGPSPKGPAEMFSVNHRDRPKPDLISTAAPGRDGRTWLLYTRPWSSCQAPCSDPRAVDERERIVEAPLPAPVLQITLHDGPVGLGPPSSVVVVCDGRVYFPSCVGECPCVGSAASSGGSGVLD